MEYSEVTISGFKSIHEEQSLLLGSLTVFAGANSGGKSSALQPLLLLKQTLESQYDPGTILIYGPNTKFTSSGQLFSSGSNIATRKSFSLGLYSSGTGIKIRYELADSGVVRAKGVDVRGNGSDFSYTETSRFSFEELESKIDHKSLPPYIEDYRKDSNFSLQWKASPDRCFPDLRLHLVPKEVGDSPEQPSYPLAPHARIKDIRQSFGKLIHISGLRGNPERSYLATAKVRFGFPGAFEDYVAAVLLNWQKSSKSKIVDLSNDLRELGLTWKIKAVPIQQTHAEIRVGRLEAPTQGGANDLVSLADVGLGVSQILPFLVALHAARPGYIVFIEQPEIHLHPRAQMRLATVIARALERGVVVWMETHSSVLLRALQILIATREIEPSVVKVNWFQREFTSGITKITAREPDRFGRFGDWPVDFDDVSMAADREYLNAVAAARKAE